MIHLSFKRSLTIDLFALLIIYQCHELCLVNSSSNYSSTSEFPEGITTFRCNNSDNEFHCDETKCIPKLKVCNGIPDCENGEDEHVRHCGCLPNEFRCSNSCIDILSRCDRNRDCENGEDEEHCDTYTCPKTHFKCQNHFCIPNVNTCDFVNDCGDNSDEYEECNHRKCYSNEFQCNNGECTRPGYLCDGIKDCKDGSDELQERCTEENFVECGDGSLQHKYFWCNGWPECTDNHADELNCGNCSGDDKFQCSNGKCIKQAELCDAHCDCLDQNVTENGANSTCEDEQDCDEYYSVENGVKVCRIGISLNCFTHIGKKDIYRCIRGEFICDGVEDCLSLGAPDEYGCNITDAKETPSDGFFCRDGRYLPKYVRCNYRIDCLSGEDEENCTLEEYRKCGRGEEPICQNSQCLKKSDKCDNVFDCFDRSDEMGCYELPCPVGWRRCLEGGQCIEEKYWCDYFKDCIDESDEIDCVRDEVCSEDQFQCKNGQCIDKKERCILTDMSKFGCADGSHLTGCGNFICDEGFYKCRSGPCINETTRCKAHNHCPGTWDNRDNCTFQCSKNADCECFDTLINCTNLSLTSFPKGIEPAITWFHFSGNKLNKVLTSTTFSRFERLLYLDLSNNSITTLIPYAFEPLWRLNTLNLQNNHIQVLESSVFFGLTKLSGLHLQGNKIRVLRAKAFYGLSSLKTLNLQNQEIEMIEHEAFVGLRNLTVLNLSHNRINFLKDDTFIGMPNLKHLDLRANRIQHIDRYVFKVTSGLKELFTDEFRFCCLAKHVTKCSPLSDEFSSCEDLMSNIVLRICIWILGIIATFANLLVIIFRTLYKNTNKVHSFLIKNLALGDLLMGIYLLIIAYHDSYYRGIYFIYDSEWRSSWTCSTAGFISTFSSELSVFTLTVITLDRLLVIIFPFRRHRLEMNRTIFLMMTGWVLAALISVIPLPLFGIDYFENFYGRSGVCLPLHITSDKPNGWEYSVFVFLFLNCLSFMIIAGSYLWMYLTAKSTHQAVQRDSRTSDSAMAFRMTLLVATDAACWFPIILLGLLSLAGFTMPSDVYAWVAVFILPLNAALNPVLYTLSTAPFMNPARKNVNAFKRTFSRNKRSCYNSTSLHCNNVHECATQDDLFSMTSERNLSARWFRKVDTVVIEHGETMPLRRVKKNIDIDD